MTLSSRITRNRRRFVGRWSVLIALVGCNALSGADKLSVAPPPATLDASDADVLPPDAGPGDESIPDATSMDVTVDTRQPLPPKHVFVTSYDQYTGNFGGRPGADDKCQQAAGNLIPNAH
jgi:hypothetical protein